jgi:catechol 2,3-dioxygenase-like lactoylglutathione lyase family enzyme
MAGLGTVPGEQGGRVGIGLSQIKHVKLPVGDVRRSASWYQALFDLELVAEYVEQGEVRGVSLLDRDGRRTEVRGFPGYGAGLDIPDPDGTLVRIAWHDPQGPSGFLGVAIGADGQPQPCRRPRLDLGGQPG